jgi:hypothetical protein
VIRAWRSVGVGQISRRLYRLGAVLGTAVGVVIGPSAALAAGPDAITLSNTAMPSTIMIRASESPEVFATVYGQVSWLRKRPVQSVSPLTDQLGPQYTVVGLVRGEPTWRYQLYPLADGGPRAFRPAAQPRGRVTAGWFYGRLNMPDALRSAGAPLAGRTAPLTGGIGGGGGESSEETSIRPAEEISKILTVWRAVVLLNGAVVFTLALGLAGIARLTRRRA